ncbi:MAG: hypothetical protein ABI831_05345 [Betaproteobacteria bacterium]
MPTNQSEIIHPRDAEAAVDAIRLPGKRVVTFLGFSGSGYEDPAAVRKTIEGVLAALDPGSHLINAGGTTAGIGMVYAIAKAGGFATAGIVSALAEKEQAELSPDADRIFVIADDTWGGRTANGTLSPTSAAMVLASVEIVAIGGDGIARDELSAAKTLGTPVRYFPADMNHEAARQKARKKGEEEPQDFGGAARGIFV